MQTIKVENMISRRSDREVANQFRISFVNKTIFQSYRSTMCVIIKEAFQDNIITLDTDHSNYTKTTRIYLSKFIQEETNNSEIYLAISKALRENPKLANVTLEIGGYRIQFDDLN